MLSQPLPEACNLVGALANLRKADAELSGGTPAELAAVTARNALIRTRADAEAYSAEVFAKVQLVQEQRLRASRGTP